MKLLYAYDSKIRGVSSGKDDIAVFQQLYKFDTDPCLVDRTNVIDWPFNIVLAQEFELPTVKQQSLKFNECAESRANQLLDIGNSIHLMWSGGIDSTAMLVSFLKTGRSLENLTIALNEDSVREYPQFYQNHIRGKFKLIATEELMQLVNQPNFSSIMLSAEHADQLFGSPTANLIHQKFGAEFLLKSADKKNVTDLLKGFGINDISSNCLTDLYAMTHKNSPRPIDTIWDWAWWHGFNFKWQEIGLKLKTRLHPGTRLMTFYSSDEFQNWSINQTPNLDSMSSLKVEPKKMILDYTKDQHYFDNKIKHPSSTLYFATPSAAGINEHGQKIKFQNFDPMDYYNPNNSIAKWLNNH